MLSDSDSFRPLSFQPETENAPLVTPSEAEGSGQEQNAALVGRRRARTAETRVVPSAVGVAHVFMYRVGGNLLAEGRFLDFARNDKRRQLLVAALLTIAAACDGFLLLCNFSATMVLCEIVLASCAVLQWSICCDTQTRLAIKTMLSNREQDSQESA